MSVELGEKLHIVEVEALEMFFFCGRGVFTREGAAEVAVCRHGDGAEADAAVGVAAADC